MLQALHIENMAVIERAELEPGPGLNVLTGETGAGKSIVIDALGAALGARFPREMVRAGASRASVTAQFAADGTEAWCSEHDVEPEDGSLFLTRSVTPDGRGACRINGTPVPVSLLREIGASLLDIHGQTDGQRMADEKYHLAYLDGFAGLREEKADYARKYEAYASSKRELSSLETDEGERERRLDLLRYQAAEIERANVQTGETDALTARRDILKNAARITDSVEEAYAALYGDTRTDGVSSLLSGAEGALRAASRWSEDLSALADRLSSLRAEADDIAETLRDTRGSLDFSPNELDELEERLSLLKRLARKYGGDEEQALAYLENCREEIERLEHSDERAEALRAETEKLRREAEKAAAALSEKRKTAAQALKSRITEELTSLSMPGASFDVELLPAELTKTGCDTVRFLIAANAGEAPGRIARVASGGELSRIMLAMKTVLSDADDVGAMVFDEIDTGVSGIAASRVAEKLARLAVKKQVICVTHLPQITAMADTHFDIAKSVEEGRTYTRVTRLDRDGRKREIARLTGGDSATETTLRAADELLSAAEAFKKGAKDG